MFIFLAFVLLTTTCWSFEPRQSAPRQARCRFSPQFSQDEVLSNSTEFENDIFFWEGQFHQDGIGFQQSNGITIDHTLLGYTTGLPGTSPSLISNPKNEAYQIMLLSHAIAGNHHAAVFTYPVNPANATELAVAILTTKLATYVAFNHTYPGYGGFLPTFEFNSTMIWPAKGWDGRVSAADNGHLVWAIHGLVQALRVSQILEIQQLALSWAKYFLYLTANAKGIFFQGPPLGSVCAISTLLSGTYPYATLQSYKCETGSGLLDNPYQGELMTWMLYFSGYLNKTEAEALWDVKRPQLQAINYTGSCVSTSHTQGGPVNYTGQPIHGRHVLPITTQRGLFFGSQEHVKLLFLPYLDVPITKRIMQNAERVRTCNSVLMRKTPGMFAAVTNTTSPIIHDQQIEYITNAGIPSAAHLQTQELDVITPYASFPTIMFDKGIGLSWYKNVLDAKCMQSAYGSVAGIRRDGGQVSGLVSWETKAPILLALLGGIVDFVRDGLKEDKVYEDFIEVSKKEYEMVFDVKQNGGRPLMGEKVELCLPVGKVSGLGLRDYSSCTMTGQ